ncbi:MAG TPA: DUF2905 domain-containing protein [Ramlibacter sp.]|nr:DUF2905 domain-containing protein [Ramlibacter sp.]
MIRWLIVVFIGLLLINAVTPWLRRIGFGRLPGDFNFKWRGRDWSLPVTTTILLSLVFGLVSKIL